ncbi:hypothetical protein GGX14DRAFT_529799, partial [Mycena pura]
MPSLNLTATPTSLTLVPPSVAHEARLGSYVIVGTLGAYIWDLLSNLNNDYKLLTEHRVELTTFVYFFSRLWTLLVLVSSTLFQTYPLYHCALAHTLVLVCYAIAVPLTCLLFFLRARAIFNRDPFPTLLLFCLWLVVVGTAAAFPFSSTAAPRGSTGFCAVIGFRPYTGAMGIAGATHDTAAFAAISWRLFANAGAHTGGGLTDRIGTLVTGKHLPRFSQALLKDGQLYYLITTAGNTAAAVLFYGGVAPQQRGMLAACDVALVNAAACHVFRHTKLAAPRGAAASLVFSMPRSSGAVYVSKVEE